jgi:predicted short-subunit dehydrogenase-like oxidoreductase (DUF2520 family)
MKIVIIGSGKVASWFGRTLLNNNHEIVQVYSRNKGNASALATALKSTPVSNLSELNSKADLYLISVSDNAISSVINEIPKVEGVVIHTSGSQDISVLKNVSEKYGVMWPVISVTKNMKESNDFFMVIEVSDEETLKIINGLSSFFTKQIVSLPYEKRQIVHLTAVFANNFTNHLITIVQEILKENQIEYSILNPLINNLVNQLDTIPAKDLQTGPAVRNDTETIEKHLQLLSNKPEYKEIYKLLSLAIKSFHKNN